jgi:multidrug efflux system membrane fusion protein
MLKSTTAARLSAVLGALALAACTADAAPPAPPPPAVSIASVDFQMIRDWDDVTGTLEAIDTVDLRPRVSGQIVATAFADGAHVRKGQVLFQIDPRPFQAEVDRLSAQVAQARAKAELATADDGRGQRLLEQNAIAKQEAERLTSEARAAKADVGAAVAALQTAQLNLSFTRVTSPIDGRVSKAMITRGNLVTPTDLLTTVVSDGPIYASFNTDEQTYLKYAAAQRGDKEPVYLGLMTEDGYPHEGRLHFLDNAVDAHSGTISGRAVFDNPNGVFTPGLFARIRLVSNAAHQAALVPEQALGTDLGKRYVLVMSADNHVAYRSVTLGRAVGQYRIVTAGLNPGDKVVVSGLQKVKPGDLVSPQPSTVKMNAAEIGTLAAVG